MNGTEHTTNTQTIGATDAPIAHAPAVNTAMAVATKTPQETAWELLQRRATAYANSTLVPKSYQGKSGVANVIIAMELADRIGANPLMVMQNLAIVNGNPGWMAKFLIGTVNTCGRFEPIEYEFVGDEGTDEWGCRAFTTRKGSSKVLRGPLVTIQTAKDEGWYDKAGSKWKTTPELMLHYRAAAFWTRVHAPELSLGMLTAEELADMNAITVPAEVVNAPASALEQELLATAPVIDAATGEILDEPKGAKS